MGVARKLPDPLSSGYLISFDVDERGRCAPHASATPIGRVASAIGKGFNFSREHAPGDGDGHSVGGGGGGGGGGQGGSTGAFSVFPASPASPASPAASLSPRTPAGSSGGGKCGPTSLLVRDSTLLSRANSQQCLLSSRTSKRQARVAVRQVTRWCVFNDSRSHELHVTFSFCSYEGPDRQSEKALRVVCEPTSLAENEKEAKRRAETMPFSDASSRVYVEATKPLTLNEFKEKVTATLTRGGRAIPERQRERLGHLQAQSTTGQCFVALAPGTCVTVLEGEAAGYNVATRLVPFTPKTSLAVLGPRLTAERAAKLKAQAAELNKNCVDHASAFISDCVLMDDGLLPYPVPAQLGKALSSSSFACSVSKEVSLAPAGKDCDLSDADQGPPQSRRETLPPMVQLDATKDNPPTVEHGAFARFELPALHPQEEDPQESWFTMERVEQPISSGAVSPVGGVDPSSSPSAAGTVPYSTTAFPTKKLLKKKASLTGCASAGAASEARSSCASSVILDEVVPFTTPVGVTAEVKVTASTTKEESSSTRRPWMWRDRSLSDSIIKNASISF